MLSCGINSFRSPTLTISKILHFSSHYDDVMWTSYVVSNYQSFNCLFNSLCGPTSTWSKKHPSPRYWPFVWGEFTGEFPAQRASNADKASIWWRRDDMDILHRTWWRYNMEPLSALLASLWGWTTGSTSGFPHGRAVWQSFDVFFAVCLNKLWNE